MAAKRSFDRFVKVNNKNIERFGTSSSKVGAIQQVWWGDESCQIRVNGGVIDMTIADLVYDIMHEQCGILNPEAIQEWRRFEQRKGSGYGV